MTTHSDLASAMPSGVQESKASVQMTSRYNPQDHVQPLVVAPRSESILDQREITITSYQTTVPFDFLKLNFGLEAAWLSPQVRFGVFSRLETAGQDSLSAVVALQDELTIRAYDYGERRPLWYSWRDAIVDTANVHYFRDEHGLLRFTVTGGGQRITDDRLHGFNFAFLRIPKDAVSKREFDPKRLRDLCFKRYSERLYTIRFAEPSGNEYQSIDHALFQSRKYISPEAERFKEIHNDIKVKVESFESDIRLMSADLASAVPVRFHIRAESGSLRLRFPKMTYRNQIKTPEGEANTFYRLVDSAVEQILDEDYFKHLDMTLDELRIERKLFAEHVDLVPVRRVMSNEAQRKAFFSTLDLNAKWREWLPHLMVLDEFVRSDTVPSDLKSEVAALVKCDPGRSIRLLEECQPDTRPHRFGAIVASALADGLHEIAAEMRLRVEQRLLSWAIEREVESWDIDIEAAEIRAVNLRWRLDDMSLDSLPAIIWKLVGILHSRLLASADDVGRLLHQFDWCMAAARSLSANHSKCGAALRLVAKGRVPRSVADTARVLRSPIDQLGDLDAAVLDQFGLPLWPLVSASRNNGMLVLSNGGVGAAWAVTVKASGDVPDGDGHPEAFDLLSDESISLPISGSCTAVEVGFEKFGKVYRTVLPIAEESFPTTSLGGAQPPSRVISRKRLDAQREYQKTIDPKGIVIGSSPALLEVFEHIHHANAMDPLGPVLLLGEPGVGKTHIARLLHDASTRNARSYKEVNAGGAGGDINIQRGEWIGYGKGHGIQNVDSKGREGHLMSVNGGTLFIDEFAGLSSDLQFIFLSVLEGRTVEKVGGESCKPDVRCIFATNADIDVAVAAGTMRRDLVDRIPVTFRIPSLRERRADILPLAKHAAGGRGITERGRLALFHHDWPGNVRELRGRLKSALARMRTDGSSKIDLAHFELPESIVAGVEKLDEDACRRELWIRADEIAREEGFDHGMGLNRRAGEILGVSESQASKKYQEYGLAPAASV